MCGLTGLWSPNLSPDAAHKTLADMVSAIHSRGPDAEGAWLDPERGIALGHRRLAVLELSDAGAQPMASGSGRYVLAFNGEIYNHLELRGLLKADKGGVHFRGTSDTETLLAGFDRWGIRETLERSAGMFAFACWDRRDHALYLARDRMGEKPLYYGWQGVGQKRSLLFGSELKALVRHPAFEGKIDRNSVTAYLARLCVPGTSSIWSGISKVELGTVVRIDASGRVMTELYWSLDETIATGVASRIEDPRAALELVQETLSAAVRSQLISDVPLGAFLSGGIDSSLIVALMQEASGGTARTFSIGFEESAFNEAHHARAVATHLRTDHHELIVTAADAQSTIPRLPQIYDEPFADSSQIPTFLVSRLAKSHVTVALSGDGADEMFGGYGRYAKALNAWQRVQIVPASLRRAAAHAAAALPSIPRRIARGAAVASAPGLVEFYNRLTNHALGAVNGQPGPAGFDGPVDIAPVERLMAHDQRGYLPDDILVKVDRASMAVSLETRAPFLDKHVVAASWRLCSEFKHRTENGATVGKWILRQLLDRYVPRSIIERPKQGFGVPVGSWLRGPLRDWADDMLAVESMRETGLLDAERVSSLWSAHRSSRADHGELIWAALMLEGWWREQEQGKPRSALATRAARCAA